MIGFFITCLVILMAIMFVSTVYCCYGVRPACRISRSPVHAIGLRYFLVVERFHVIAGKTESFSWKLTSAILAGGAKYVVHLFKSLSMTNIF